MIERKNGGDPNINQNGDNKSTRDTDIFSNPPLGDHYGEIVDATTPAEDESNDSSDQS